MQYMRLKSGAVLSTAILLAGLAGCGGSKVLREPEPLVLTESLAATSDQHLAATLDWVIVRGGPGTWAKNADWDEYLIRVQNPGAESIRVTNISVLDSLGTRIGTRGDRKQLVNGTVDAKRRYKGNRLEVKAGASGKMLVTGAAVAGAASAAIVGSSIGYGLGGATMGTGAAAAATGGLILVPVLAVSGIMRGVNNSKVDEAIRSRQTALPIELQEGEEKYIHIFFPLTPSPRQVDFAYADSRGDHTLIIDTHAALEGLHLSAADK